MASLSIIRLVRLGSLGLALHAALASAKAPPALPSTEKVDDPWIVRATGPVPVTLLNNAPATLGLLLQLINEAHSSIEIELLGFQALHDVSGQWLLRALSQKAREGVRVRILVDWLRSRKEDDLLTAVLPKLGLEIRFWNIKGSSWMYRDHRKLWIFDRERLVIGGRNVADHFFIVPTHDPTHRVVFDRDALVEGEFVSRFGASFDAYWNHPLAQSPVQPPKIEDVQSLETALNSPLPLEQIEMQTQLNTLLQTTAGGASGFERVTCSHLTLMTDPPGLASQNRFTGGYLLKMLQRAQNSILMETPIFDPPKAYAEVLDAMLDRGGDLEIHSVGLADHDYFAVVSLNGGINHYAKRGARIFVHALRDGGPAHPRLPPSQAHVRMMNHAKSLVIDDRDAMITSHNMDFYATYINAEASLICENDPAFAAALARNIHLRASGVPEMAPGFEKGFSSQATILRKMLYPVGRVIAVLWTKIRRVPADRP